MRSGAALLERARSSIPDYDFPNAATAAADLAAANFESNRIALERVWPAAAVALPDELPEMEWLFARDGALSARHCDGHWFADVSVPRRAAERMLASLEVGGACAIMLAPTHAAQVRVALDRLDGRQALIVILPGEYAAGVICGCASFADEIRARRLWLIVGPAWPDELDALLDGQPGLAPATTMIRVPGLNEAGVDRMIKPCERVVNKHAALHRQRVALLQAKPRPAEARGRRVCVVTGGFELWQAEGAMLERLAARSSLDCVTFDASRPDCGSALVLARAVDGCDAILTANLTRADLPGVVPDGVAWTTWLTSPRVPVVASVGPRDRLLVAHADQRHRALAVGWPDERVRIVRDDAIAPSPAAARDVAVPALILNLRPPAMPKSIAEMSSHAIVWERARRTIETIGVPGGVASPADLVARCADLVGVPRDGLPIDLICETAVLPAFARRVAIELANARVAFAIFGDGWSDVPEAAAHLRGPIATLDAFDAAVVRSSAILDVWPGVSVHASRRCGRPIVRTWGRSPGQVEQDGRVAATRIVVPVQASTAMDVALAA